MILRMVELTHQAVDIGRCVPTDVGDEEGDKLRGNVVKHRAVNTDLLQNVPCKAITRAQDRAKNSSLISSR